MKPAWKLSEAALLDHIRKLPHGKASLKQLIREIGAKGANKEILEASLDQLVSRGELIALRQDQFVAATRTREFVTGHLQMHRHGYGFVIADRPIEGLQGDVFVPPAAAEQAMHGDRVIVRVRRVREDGRAEGEIVRILKRAYPTVVGELRVHAGRSYVVPYHDRIPSWIEVPAGLEIPTQQTTVNRIGSATGPVSGPDDLDGMIVEAEILEFPGREGRATGRVTEILGHPDDFGIDVEIVIRKHHLPHKFPPEVLAQAATFPSNIPTEEISRRRDFRALDVVTIDGESARDFDDAVWVDQAPDGNFVLHVHIADVTYYVRPGTPIDREAALRGTSVYFPDRAVPMLPLELSTELCSLKPHADRLVLSVLIEIDHRGDVVRQECARGVIRSVERMTYTDVHLLLEGDASRRERYHTLIPRFEIMRELALILNRKRARRGSLDFDLPEPLIEFDEWGEMTGITKAPRNIAHRIIEEFMLAANEAVARHLETAGVPSLYRIHEAPDPARVLEFEQIAAQFGYSLGLGLARGKRFPIVDRKSDGRKVRKDITLADDCLEVTARHYQHLAEKVQGRPEERILNYLMLRSLKQARYSPDNQGHFALATSTYTHFTSPIRRYPDLVVHRILSALLDGLPQPQLNLNAIADQCSVAERRAAEAERELVEWKKAKFMAERVGEDFDALIISTLKSGFFVELEDLFVEGFVPIDSLPGERYGFHETTRQIIAERSRQTFKVGDRVRVRLDRVHALEHKLMFSLVEIPGTNSNSRKKRKQVKGSD